MLSFAAFIARTHRGFWALLLVLVFAQCAHAKPSLKAKKPTLQKAKPYAVNYFPALRWRVTLGMAKNTTPAIADLDLDGRADLVIAAADENTLYRLADGGEVIWKIALPAPVTAGVTLGDVDRDGTLDILLACGKGLLCYDARGKEKWSFATTEIIQSFPTIADIDGDGKPEVIFGANDSRLHVLDAGGREKWSFETKSWIVGGVSVADLDGDRKLEIVFGSLDYNVYCLDINGQLKWKYATEDWVASSPVVADLDGDGTLEMVASSDDGYLYCLSRRGTLKWRARWGEAGTRAQPYLAVADLDGDGTRETVLALPSGQISTFLSNGDVAWNRNAGSGIVGSPLIADLNGDGSQDIVVASQGGYLLSYSTWGNVQWNTNLGQTIEATPTLADLDGDGKWEVYLANIGAKGDSGFFSAYELSAKGGVGQWTTLKGDPYRTGLASNARDYAVNLRRGGDYATAWAPFGIGYRPAMGVQKPRRLRVTMLPLDDAAGNRDGALDPGETAWVRVQVKNLGTGPSYDSRLNLELGRTLLKIDRKSAFLGWIAPGATKTAVFRITAPPISQILEQTAPTTTFRDIADETPDAPAELPIKTKFKRVRRRLVRVPVVTAPPYAARQYLLLRVTESNVPAALARAQVFTVPPLPPTLQIASLQVLDGRSAYTSGNGNGRLEAGETAILRILLNNTDLTTATTATATLGSATNDILPATTAVPMRSVVPYGGRNLDFSVRVAKQLSGKPARLKLSIYTATRGGPAPARSQMIVLPLSGGVGDVTPPTIAWSSPKTKLADTRAGTFTLAGVVSDASGIAALWFENRPVNLKNLRRLAAGRYAFSFSRALHVGENVFPLSVRDSAGNSATQWVRVVRKP